MIEILALAAVGLLIFSIWMLAGATAENVRLRSRISDLEAVKACLAGELVARGVTDLSDILEEPVP